MVELLNNLQEPFIFLSIFIVVCAASNSNDVNKVIDQINDENLKTGKKQLPRASYYPLIFAAILLVISLIPFFFKK